jgi:lysozyme family protein
MAALRQADLHTLAHDFCETRIEHYQLDAGWTHDGDGWTNRANATCAKAVSLI